MVDGARPADLSVVVLRELFRNLRFFMSLYEAEGIEEICRADGTVWCLWDILYLYDEGMKRLPKARRRAIQLFLIDNVMEKEAAVLMGVSADIPVASYATKGLETLIELIRQGELPRFNEGSSFWVGEKVV